MILLLFLILLIILLLIYFRKILNKSIGLIPENTIILLKNGNNKKIQDIKIGDILLNDFEVHRIEMFEYVGDYYKINNIYLTDGLPFEINNQLFSINPNETEKINPKYQNIKKLKYNNIIKEKYPYKFTYNLISNTNNYRIPTNYGVINNLNDFIMLDEIEIDSLNEKELKIFSDNLDLFKKAFPEDN
jgi:hypothetical protein